MAKVDTREIKDFAGQLEQADRLFVLAAKRHVPDILDVWAEPLKTYPPAPRQSSRFPRYVRGVGTLHADGRVSPLSEKLTESWQPQLSERQGMVTGELGTDVTYATQVQGDEQAANHTKTGWVTVRGVMTATSQEVEAVIDDLLDTFLGELCK